MKLKWQLTAISKEIEVLRDILGDVAPLPIMVEECSGAINSFSAKLPGARVDYSAKKFCKEMSICDAAKAYFKESGS